MMDVRYHHTMPYNIQKSLTWWMFDTTWQCSGSVVVTAYDSESGRPSSNPEWGLIYYEASITAQGLPEPSSVRGSTLDTSAAEHKGCNWGMQVDWWLQPCTVFNHCFSGRLSAGICHRNKVNSIAWLYRTAQPKDSIIYITLHYHHTMPYDRRAPFLSILTPLL